MKGKVRMKRTEGDKVYVVKTLKLIDEAQAEDIKDRQEKARELRRQHRKAKNKDQKKVNAQ